MREKKVNRGESKEARGQGSHQHHPTPHPVEVLGLVEVP